MEEENVDDFLQHYGVLGMHWGHHKNAIEGVSGRTSREARRDANEFAKAKMFYGDGAGTRRKLIKAKVESKAKKDPSYQKAFDHHLNNQDLGKRASQARGERRRKDVSSGVGKHARSVHRILTGGMGNVTMLATVGVAGYGVAKATGADKVVINAVKQGFDAAVKSDAAQAVKDAFLKNGWK